MWVMVYDLAKRSVKKAEIEVDGIVNVNGQISMVSCWLTTEVSEPRRLKLHPIEKGDCLAGEELHVVNANGRRVIWKLFYCDYHEGCPLDRHLF